MFGTLAGPPPPVGGLLVTCLADFILLAITVGFLDFRRGSGSPELQSFLLSMCIDAPESTTSSRSSGDFGVGAGVALASLEEYNVASPVFLRLLTFFATSHASLGAQILAHTDCVLEVRTFA